jgi:hypothetical protein
MKSKMSTCKTYFLLVVLMGGCASRNAPVKDSVQRIDSLKQSVISWSKKQEVVRDCMLRSGFKYVSPKRPAPPPKIKYFGSRDLVRLKKFRYGLATGNPSISRSEMDPNFDPARSSEEQKRFDEALYGTAEAVRGCDNEGTTAATNDQSLQVLNTFGDLLERNPRAKSLLKKWSRCMAVRGYTVSHPREIPERFLAPIATKSLTSEIPMISAEDSDFEKALAASDADCYDPINEEMAKIETLAAESAFSQ